MSTIRVEKTANYSVISNVPLNDERLSWDAKGVIAYLLSKPNDWVIRVTDLIKKSPSGQYVVRRVLRELEQYGYLERKRYKDKTGKFYWEQVLYETPKAMSGFSTDGLSTCGKVPDITSTDLSNGTEIPKTKGATSAHHPRAKSAEDMAFDQWFTDKRQHPAIKAIKQVWGWYPRKSKAMYEGLIDMIGDDPDIPRLERAYAEAVGAKGMNPNKMLIIVRDGYLHRFYYEVDNVIKV